MNRVITTHVVYRGREIPVSNLRDNSNLKITIECRHGQRTVKWVRRNQFCKKCAVEAGVFNTSKVGRDITWGDKISEAKKGKKFSEKHKDALTSSRRKKLCKRLNISEQEFKGFPTKGEQYKLRCCIMNALKQHMISISVKDQDTLIVDTLGYTFNDLRNHLESKFESGMTWDNYGEWHIDHITPESWFSYTEIDSDQFRQCWSLENLQPMWAAQNRRKNNLYLGKYKEPFFYMLCGQSGCGKTTLANKLTDIYHVISIDKITKKDLDKILRNNWHNDKPVLLDISVHISTTYRRYVSRYRVMPVFLIESIDTVKANIGGRGGRVDNVDARYNRVIKLSKEIGIFSGCKEEVLDYLINEQKTFRNRHDCGESAP